MQTDGLVEEVIVDAEETPLPIAIALAVWLIVALVLVGASVFGGMPPAG